MRLDRLNQDGQRGSGRYAIQLLSVVLMLLLLHGMGMPQESRDIAMILKVIGNVEVNKGGNGTWIKGKKGIRLDSGNIIKTGDRSLAALVFTDDKSLVKVRSNSELTIRGKREKKKVKKSLFMRLGDLWAKVTKGNPFQVETPSGVAAVKGTEFYLRVEIGGDILYLKSGLMELVHRQLGRIVLNPGERGEMGPGRGPTKRKAAASEMPDWGGNDNLENELKIEFEKDGERKYLKIRIK